MKKKFDIVSIGTVAYDLILRTVNEAIFRRDTTKLEAVGISAGGAALTQTVVAQRLGCRAAIVGKICRDEFGSYLHSILTEAGVDCTQLTCMPAGRTSLTFALVRENGERHFLGLMGENNRTLCLDNFDLSIVQQARIVSYGSFFALPGLDGEGATRIMEEAKNSGAVTVADAASDSFQQGREVVFQSLPLLDYFIPSYAEAQYLTGEKTVPEMARALRAWGCKNVLIKVGEDGCYVDDGEKAMIVSGFCQECVRDTTGAGDNFVGGFLAGLAEGRSLLEAVQYANAVASISVTGMGALSALKGREQVNTLFENDAVQNYNKEKEN